MSCRPGVIRYVLAVAGGRRPVSLVTDRSPDTEAALVTFFGCDVTLTPISHQPASQTGKGMGLLRRISSAEATRQKYFRNVNRPYCKLAEYGAA